MRRHGSRDDQFARIETLLPGRPGWAGRNSERGNRLFVETVIWKFRSGAPWRTLRACFFLRSCWFRRPPPPSFASPSTRAAPSTSTWPAIRAFAIPANALLGFHQARPTDGSSNEIVALVQTQRLMDIYPARVRRWISRNGGLSSDLIFLHGKPLTAMVRRCRGAELL